MSIVLLTVSILSIVILAILCIIDRIEREERNRENEIRRWVSDAVRAAEVNCTSSQGKRDYVWSFLATFDFVGVRDFKKIDILIMSEVSKNKFDWRV